MKRRLLAAAAALALTAPALGQSVDLQATNRIMAEGLDHSQVMTTAEHLSDQIGPRLTGSPNVHKAEAWTQEKFREWGMKNVHLEPFAFGRGWWIEHASARMVAPRPVDLVGIPVAWSPPTDGPVTAPVVLAPLRTAEDFAKWHGKLAGKIVLVNAPGAGSEPDRAAFNRLSDADIQKLDTYRLTSGGNPSRSLKRLSFAGQLDAFLKSEGALAQVTESRSDGKLIHGEGTGTKSATARPCPPSSWRRRIIAGSLG